MPSRSHARHSSAASPSGSAAAISTSRRVSGGKRFQALAEARLDPARERRAGQDEAARELRRRQPAGKFEQRERVAARLVDDALAHLLVERASDDGVQQRLRVAPTQAFDDQLRQALERIVGLTCGQDQAQRFREQPARDERQRLQRRAIEPLGVVDDTHQRAFAGHVGEQAQDRQPDEEAIGWRARHQPERRAQRVPLRPRQPLETIEHRRAQLVQAGERELHLGVDPGGPGHAPFGCPPSARARGAPTSRPPARRAARAHRCARPVRLRAHDRCPHTRARRPRNTSSSRACDESATGVSIGQARRRQKASLRARTGPLQAPRPQLRRW